MAILVIRSVLIYILVVLAVRIMGKRQVGELKPHELVITILISSVATVPLQENSMPLANSILPVLIFVSLEILNSALSMKSIRFRNLIQGKPIIIIKDGILQQNELSRLRFTIDDLIDALRQQNVFDISTVQNAVVETNGTLSVQTKAESAPATPSDLGLHPEQATMPITIVMDGKKIDEYFGANKIKESEITLLTQATGEKIENIMLLTVDSNGKMYLIRKDNNK